MSSGTGACNALFKGVHALAWDLPVDMPVTPGMMWRWQGQALRLDRGAQALWLSRPLARGENRPRARARAGRIAAQPASAPTDRRSPCHAAGAEPGDSVFAPDHPGGSEPAPPGGLILTDGRQLYPARLVEAAGGTAIVFDPWLPPPDTDLWVTACAGDSAPARRATTSGIAAGTLIETDTGPRPVETLAAGDRVMTRDNGLQPVLWQGETRLSGAELILHPHLRPVRLMPGALGQGAAGARPAGLLRLAPGHRLVVSGLPEVAGRRESVTGSEALARAGDLEDGRRIRRDLGCRSVIYVNLLLPRHEVLRIEGVDCESFHPALADRVALRWHARGLERAVPGLTTMPERFGETARRCLSAAEAALLACAA